jgi:DNA polymerase-3 subunit delta'
VLEGADPDCIEVEGEGVSGLIKVDRIREVRAAAQQTSLGGERRVVIVYGAENLAPPSANALLKILEEPPAYGVFVLLTDNPDKLLPTVRSRCTELKMLPLNEDILRRQLRQDRPEASEEDISAAMMRSGGFLGQARQLLEEGGDLPQQTEGFLEAFGKKDALLLTQVLTPMEKWKRDALAEILQQWIELLESALASRSGIHAISARARELSRLRTAPELYRAVGKLKQALEYTLSNVSPAAVCGWLTWELR